MPGSVRRTITCLIAEREREREREGSDTLEQSLKNWLDTVESEYDTIFELGDSALQTRHWRATEIGVRLHIAAWTEGQKVSTVPHKGADLGVIPPGKDYNYLSGDGMVLVKSNYCLLMPSGLSGSVLRIYLKHIDRSFHIAERADPSVWRQIVSQNGAKKIIFDLALAENELSTGVSEGFGAAFLKSLVALPDERQAIQEADNVRASLQITVNTRRRGGIAVEDFGAAVAPQLGEDDERAIRIETGGGQIFDHGKLILRKPVSVDSFGQTVNHGHAWALMEEYLRELRDRHLLI